jgi:hypothetical protein
MIGELSWLVTATISLTIDELENGMELPIYQVDAFTDKLFKGNPAAVMPLEAWPDDAVLQAIAMENNLSETA